MSVSVKSDYCDILEPHLVIIAKIGVDQRDLF